MRQPVAGLVLWLATAGTACSGESNATSDSVVLAEDTLLLAPFFRDLRTVAGSVGGHEGHWLFDTGGGITLITPEVAERTGCRPYGQGTGFRMSGEPIRFQWCDGVELRFGAFTWRPERVAVFDVNALLPAPLRSLSGVLSLDAFREHVVTIDWPGGVALVRRGDPDGRILATRLATGPDGLQLTALVAVDGVKGPLWFLLDSGNIEGTLVSPHVLHEGLLPMASDSTIAVPGIAPDSRLLIALKSTIYDGVLGTAFLLLGRVQLDLR